MKFSLETNISRDVLDKDQALGLFSGLAEQIMKEMQGPQDDGGEGNIRLGYYWKLVPEKVESQK